MERTVIDHPARGAIFSILCGLLLAGCDSPPPAQPPAEVSADDVRVGPIVRSWSADALPSAGERPTWIAAASHRDGVLGLWSLEPGRQFRLVGTYPDVGFHPDGVRWVDLEPDGQPELLVAAEGEGKIQLWRPEATGKGIRLVAAVGGGKAPLDVVAGDLDADGHADLVSTPYEGSRLSILWGRGSFSFDVSSLPTKEGDPGHEGTNVFGDAEETGAEGADVSPLPQSDRRATRSREDDRDLPSQAPDRRSRRPSGPRVFASHGRIRDWDGDGRLDVLWSDRGGGAIFFGKNLGDRRFEVRELRPAEGGSPRQIALADLDADGAVDLVATLETGGKALVLYNDGQGGVRMTEDIPAPSWGFSNVTAVGGAQPMVVLTLDQSVILARQGADGWKQRRLSTGGFPLDPKLVDLDGDGALDLLVANSTGEDLSVIFGPLWERAREFEQ